MNRWDEIQGLARDIASNVHADPQARDAMADGLIKLCGLMIGAVGKAVSIDGESSMNMGESVDADVAAYSRYMVGERVQDAAKEAVEQSSNPGCDLDRWTRPSPGDSCACGHVPSVHEGGRCTGEQYNREACKGGPCTGFVRREPTGGWRHVDRRPAALRGSGPVTVTVAEPQHAHNWVTALDEMGQPARDAAGETWQHCGVCGVLPPSRPCCYGARCVTCRYGGPMGGCCFPLGAVCPKHH